MSVNLRCGMLPGQGDYRTLICHFGVLNEHAVKIPVTVFEKNLIEGSMSQSIVYINAGAELTRVTFERIFNERKIANIVLVAAHITIVLLMISFIGKCTLEGAGFFDYMGLVSLPLAAVALIVFDVFRCRANSDMQIVRRSVIPRIAFEDQVVLFNVIRKTFTQLAALSDERKKLRSKLRGFESKGEQVSLGKAYRSQLKQESSSSPPTPDDSSDMSVPQGRHFYVKATDGRVKMRISYAVGCLGKMPDKDKSRDSDSETNQGEDKV